MKHGGVRAQSTIAPDVPETLLDPRSQPPFSFYVRTPRSLCRTFSRVISSCTNTATIFFVMSLLFVPPTPVLLQAVSRNATCIAPRKWPGLLRPAILPASSSCLQNGLDKHVDLTSTEPSASTAVPSTSTPAFNATTTTTNHSSSSSTTSVSGSPAVVAQRTVIVPGKFDSFHVGHRRLAEAAAALLDGGGVPTLLSFYGMSTALNWRPRPPVVAPIERARVLRTWSMQLGQSVLWETLPFDDVQHMTPEQFIAMLVARFNARGIVCGPDWRFGKGRSGDVHLLRQLAHKYDLDIVVVDPVFCDDDTIVSSTLVRDTLGSGDVELVAQLLGRPHRVVGYTVGIFANSDYNGEEHGKEDKDDDEGEKQDAVVCGGFVNMLPKNGTYHAVVRVIGRAEPLRTNVTVYQDDKGETRVRLRDAQEIYCADCEIYIDFLSRVPR